MRALHEMLDPRDHMRSCPTLAGAAPRVEAFAQVRPAQGTRPELPVTVVRCIECAGQVVIDKAYTALMNELAGQLVAAARQRERRELLMANDALDPGPDGSYPYWPRNADGSWDEVRMPTGERLQRTPTGGVVRIDVTPRHPDGTPIVPPGMVPP